MNEKECSSGNCKEIATHLLNGKPYCKRCWDELSSYCDYYETKEIDKK